MAESASGVALAAKTEHQALKEQLKINEHSFCDKDVEFRRKTLRRHYLRLLLVYPYSPESKDCENHLWMQTSYSFITAYKQRVAALDTSSNNPNAQRQNAPVEYRKLLNRFRQFLAEEEKFWAKLVIRLCRSFQLTEAASSLVKLGIIASPDELLQSESEQANGKSPRNERNQYQFPPEDPIPLPSTEQRPGKLAILSKAMICLGDIARYREQYNESGGRPRAGHNDNVPATRGRGRRGAAAILDTIPRPRNYDKSQRCYEQARLMLSTEGNPFHQLAIIASYKKDNLSCILNYYRALCVRQPYETASENLTTVLSKSLDSWKARIRENGANVNDEPSADITPRVRIRDFKEQVGALHALWYLGGEKMDPFARDVAGNVCRDFHDLVTNRLLPAEFISNMLILGQAAHWRHRMIRAPGYPTAGATSTRSPGPEYHIFSHILAVYGSLLEVGLEQLGDSPPADLQEQDLDQRISAVFRRTLPALRIGSKWLRANLDYILKISRESKDAGRTKDGRQKILRNFWDSYSRFLRALTRSFPLARLPSWKGPLEEDIDMRGFLPLKGMMDSELSVGSDMEPSKILSEVHPNVLELMRIFDLIQDAQLLTETDGSPLAKYGNNFVLKGVEAENIPDFLRTPSTDANAQSNTGSRHFTGDLDDDARTEITSHTDEEVIREAFRVVDNPQQEDDDEREEQIVWPRGNLNRTEPAPISPASNTPNIPQSNVLPQPTNHQAQPRAPGTTARDLLNTIKGRSINISSTPLGPTIWSASQDEQALTYPSQSASSLHLRTSSTVQHPDPTLISQYPSPTHARNQSRTENLLPGVTMPSDFVAIPPHQSHAVPFNSVTPLNNFGTMNSPNHYGQGVSVVHTSPYMGFEGHPASHSASLVGIPHSQEGSHRPLSYHMSPQMWNEVG